MRLRRQAGTVVAAYAACAALWIAVSDRVAAALVKDPALHLQVGTYKGFFFVLATSLLLTVLLRRILRTVNRLVTMLQHDVAIRRSAEEAAERERAFADHLVEAMPGILYLYDETGRFLRWNQNFGAKSGYSDDEIARMQPLDFFGAEHKELLGTRIAAVFDRGESAVEAELLSKDGVRTPYFFTGRRVELDGRACLVGVGVDITERKRAEQELSKSEARYRRTLDSILEGCQLVDFDWRYVYLNDAAATHNRRPNADLLGRQMLEEWPSMTETPLYAMLSRAMTERAAVRGEVEFHWSASEAGWFDVSAQPTEEGLFLLSIDIGERKKAEQALRELNESLERKVEERTVALAEAKIRAEAADRIKSSFLATMSHELRTPLNSILGFTGILVQGLAGPLNAEQAKQLGMVQGSARHLLDLINDVLDISKIEAGQLEVRSGPFDLRASVERVVASLQPLAEKRGIALRADLDSVPRALTSDRRRVEQILLNLLNNGLKFTERGAVTLSVQAVGAAVRFDIHDTGIGMRTEDLAGLFQPFHQVESGLQRRHEGTGLGLAITRRLTELLGGTIHVRSEPRQGSVFTVELPAEPPTP